MLEQHCGTSPALQRFCTALAPSLSRSGSFMALGSTTPSEAAMGDSKSVLFLTQQMGCCLQKGNEYLCMAHSLTGMSGEALMSLPHKQLPSASSSTASWVTSCFANSPSFLPHSPWMEHFAGGSPTLVSSFLYSSAFSVVPVQLLTLKSGSLEYLGYQKGKKARGFFLTQIRIAVCFLAMVPAHLVGQ